MTPDDTLQNARKPLYTDTHDCSENRVCHASPECPENTVDTECTVYNGQIKTVEDVLRRALPIGKSQADHCLFILARGVKALEMAEGVFMKAKLKEVFDRWYFMSQPFLKADMTKDQYYARFVSTCVQTKSPLGGEVILKAWKLANKEPLPEEAYEFEDPKIQLLVAFCWQMQILAAPEPFFLSCRTVQGLLEQETHSTAAEWLRALRGLKIIIEVEKGKRPKASSYRYCRIPALSANFGH